MDLLKKELERKRKAIELAKKTSGINLRVAEHRGAGAGAGASGGKAKNGKSRSYLKASELRKFQQQQEEEEREKRLQRNRMVGGSSSGRRNGSNSSRGNSSSGSGSRDEKNVDDKNEFSKGKDAERRKKRRRDEQSGDDGINNTTGSSNDGDNEALSETGGSKFKSKDHSSLNDGDDDDDDDEKIMNKGKDTTVTVTMSSAEITDALRNLGIPVWLFGERDDAQRMERLREARDSRKAAMAGMSENDDFKLGSGHGIRNPFLGGKKNQDGGDDADLNLNLGLTAAAAKKQKQDKLDGSRAHNTSQTTKDDKVSRTENGEDDDVNIDDDPHKAIHRFFKSQLKQWEEDLVNRTDVEKRSLTGKNETKTLKQCKDYIRPLFKLCKNRRLEESLMGHLVKIVKFCKEGEFVKANDSYMDVAIGRAAWPIGVTMVGIHARSGRAKIESANVAHVMNSELQRKYLTSVKRLMTYCQKKRTDVAPSKKVTNG